MSPEQAAYRPTDRRSDIFSLGIVFYELLTCTELFQADDTVEVLANLMREELPSVRDHRPDLPDELDRILYKALEREADARFPDAGTMGHELEFYMYNDRFGPTNITLAQYMTKFFPKKATQQKPTPGSISRVSKRFPKIELIKGDENSTEKRDSD